MKVFAERLRNSLKASNISQTDLAKRVKMSKSIINNYCSGKREPSLDVLVLICKELDETSDYLLGLSDN